MIYFLCITFLLLHGITLAFFYLIYERALQERQVLLDRIQAPDIHVFKSYQQEEEKKEQPIEQEEEHYEFV